ncbi:MAG TPA: hypothetical protein VN428_18035 [Bryobacteraceae bacterium]|nr:hypothetical protein [Bryobacteraceae bacterium]
MAGKTELVTVFSSDAVDAEEQCNVLRDMLLKANMNAEVMGKPDAVIEVRVPAAQAEDARRFIETQQDFTPSELDLSHDLDMVTVFSSQDYNAELLATGIRSVLEARDIPSVLVSASVFPSLPFEVRVPRERLEEARKAIAAAQEAGPSAAEEAAREFEAGGGTFDL